MPDGIVFEHDVKRNRHRLNEQYVRRGEIVLDLAFLDPWRSGLRETNSNKRGRPFEYPRSFITFARFVGDVQSMTYRAAEGFLRMLGSVLSFVAPDHTTHWRREVK